MVLFEIKIVVFPICVICIFIAELLFGTLVCDNLIPSY